MTRSAETKESTINSWRKNVETDREKRLENAVQKATKNLFSHLSDKEQNDIIKQINEYLKTPDSIKPRELFQKLIEIKNNNPNNPKLAQIIINHIKKLNEKKHAWHKKQTAKGKSQNLSTKTWHFVKFM